MLVAWNLIAEVYNQREKEEIWLKDAWDPSTPAVALRGGKITQVTTRELVPGDIIHVSEVRRSGLLEYALSLTS